ncbi:MAG: hypothetical protein R3B67_13795 [Phycisphaerales bacterium]
MRFLLPLTIAIAAGSATASNPTLGGPMSHLLVTVFNNEVFLSFESPSMSTVTMQDNDGTFTAGASVLNNTGYNAQFGWLANGFISIPPSSGIFVRHLAGSPHLSVHEETSFQPILGTDGSSDVWQWDGTMTHNWYSTDTHVEHAVRYEVFVGDTLGNPLAGFTSSTIDLHFEYGPDLSGRIGVRNGGTVAAPPTPTPGTLACLLTGMGFITKRRR